MADFDQTLPLALAETNALDYDYNDGNGVDFERLLRTPGCRDGQPGE